MLPSSSFSRIGGFAYMFFISFIDILLAILLLVVLKGIIKAKNPEEVIQFLLGIIPLTSTVAGFFLLVFSFSSFALGLIAFPIGALLLLTGVLSLSFSFEKLSTGY